MSGVEQSPEIDVVCETWDCDGSGLSRQGWSPDDGDQYSPCGHPCRAPMTPETARLTQSERRRFGCDCWQVDGKPQHSLACPVPEVEKIVRERLAAALRETPETDALDAVVARLRQRIAEGREDPETSREGSYFAGYLDGLKSGLAEVLWEPSTPPGQDGPQ